MGGVGNVAVGGVEQRMERRGGMQKDLLVSFFKIILVVVIIVAVGRKGGKERRSRMSIFTLMIDYLISKEGRT
jgi:hypothetical protein